MDRPQIICGVLLLGIAAAFGLFLVAPHGRAPAKAVAAAVPAATVPAATVPAAAVPAVLDDAGTKESVAAAEQRLAEARHRLAEVAAYGPSLGAGPVGIDCGHPGSGSGFDFLARDKAEKSQDWMAAIRMTRGEIADQGCRNAYLWSELALFYAAAGMSGEALEVADFLLEHWPNRVAESLEVQEDAVGDSLNALRQLPEFAASRFARRLAVFYGEREQRLRAARLRLAAMPTGERPPERYVARDACPFECCTFREWTVEKEIPLFEAPAGELLGRRLEPGSSVLGLTGEVHLRPRPILAGRSFVAELSGDSREKVEIAAGALVFQLDHLGEGSANFWHRGRVFYTQVSQCLVFDDECWGDALEPDAAQTPHEWWVKVRLADGTEAWALGDGFGNMDSCA